MTAPPDSLASSLVGTVLDGRYRLDESIGHGGMGDVYLARHLLMDQKVAVKLLRASLVDDTTAIKRFAREARSTFRFDHPHCIRVTDFGATPDGLLYMVMEYLSGRTVADELASDGPYSPARVLHIARQVCEALDHAHEIGFLHRDIKPENVMLLSRGGDPDFVKVLDFGLAKLVTEPTGGITAMSLTPLTRKGMVFGTPEYMSPEQAIGQPLSPATDIYALGVVMYEMLSGQVPFQAQSFMGVLTKHVQEPPTPPGQLRPTLGIPPQLDEMVMDCLAKEPGERPATARALAARLGGLESLISRPGSRLPEELAASSAMDLATDAATGPAAHSATYSAGYADSESPSAAMAVHGSVPHVSQPACSAVPAAGPVRWRSWVMFAIISVVVLVALIAVFTQGSPAEPQSGGPGASAEVPDVLDMLSGAAIRAPGVLPDIAAEQDARPEQTAPDPVVDATAVSSGKPATAPVVPPVTEPPAVHTGESAAAGRAATTSSRPSSRVKAHLRAARAAQKKKNVLEQLAEAHGALRADPGSLEATYLVGDALVHSDKSRGCDYLREARSLRKARESYRRAGCKPEQ